MTERQLWFTAYHKAREFYTDYKPAIEEANEVLKKAKEFSNHE